MVGGVWLGCPPPVESSDEHDEHDEHGDADDRLVHDWSVKKRLRKKLRRFEFREFGRGSGDARSADAHDPDRVIFRRLPDPNSTPGGLPRIGT